MMKNSAGHGVTLSHPYPINYPIGNGATGSSNDTWRPPKGDACIYQIWQFSYRKHFSPNTPKSSFTNVLRFIYLFFIWRFIKICYCVQKKKNARLFRERCFNRNDLQFEALKLGVRELIFQILHFNFYSMEMAIFQTLQILNFLNAFKTNMQLGNLFGWRLKGSYISWMWNQHTKFVLFKCFMSNSVKICSAKFSTPIYFRVKKV